VIRSISRWAVGTLISWSVTLPVGGAGGEVAQKGPMNVRANASEFDRIIQIGMACSRTFTTLLDEVDRTDGLVYLDKGRCGHSVHSCLPFSLIQSGAHRLLRIVSDLKGSDREVAAAIGHELQHTLEVLREPSIRSAASMYLFYSRIAPTANEAFEAPGAIAVELAIQRDFDQRRTHYGLCK
jgi:hypothetical protein